MQDFIEREKMDKWEAETLGREYIDVEKRHNRQIIPKVGDARTYSTLQFIFADF